MEVPTVIKSPTVEYLNEKLCHQLLYMRHRTSFVRRASKTKKKTAKIELSHAKLDAIEEEIATPSVLGESENHKIIKIGDHQYGLNIIGQNNVNIYFELSGTPTDTVLKLNKSTGQINTVSRVPISSLRRVTSSVWWPILISFVLVVATFLLGKLGVIDAKRFAHQSAYLWNTILYTLLTGSPPSAHTIGTSMLNKIMNFVADGASTLLNTQVVSNMMSTLGNAIVMVVASRWLGPYLPDYLKDMLVQSQNQGNANSAGFTMLAPKKGKRKFVGYITGHK